jgi:hypothetical protein
VFGGTSSTTTRRDIAFDNDNLVYDQFYATGQGGTCTPGTQAGQVAFDQLSYGTCPSTTAYLSVLDANGVSGMTVTVTSPGTGDSEIVTLTGSAPFFSGPLPISTVSGVGANNGTLFVLPSETISVSYNDSSPLATTTRLRGRRVHERRRRLRLEHPVLRQRDNDGIADNNECVTLNLTIRNNTAQNLTNARVQIVSTSPNVDLVQDDHAAYGTVLAGTSATNPGSDRFTFHVAAAVDCTDPANPPVASFTVLITADNLSGARVLQTFTLNLDQNVAPRDRDVYAELRREPELDGRSDRAGQCRVRRQHLRERLPLVRGLRQCGRRLRSLGR